MAPPPFLLLFLSALLLMLLLLLLLSQRRKFEIFRMVAVVLVKHRVRVVSFLENIIRKRNVMRVDAI